MTNTHQQMRDRMTSLVHEFMNTFDQVCYSDPEHTPCEVSLLRANLIDEETLEFGRAPVGSEDELDALCDLAYVVLGTALALGVSLDPARKEVANAWVVPRKQSLFAVVKGAVQDLYSRFPCEKIQRRELTSIMNEIFLVAELVGYDLLSAFEEVHRSNMTKLWSEKDYKDCKECYAWKMKGDKYIVRNASGKIVKPPSFTPPNLGRFL